MIATTSPEKRPCSVETCRFQQSPNRYVPRLALQHRGGTKLPFQRLRSRDSIPRSFEIRLSTIIRDSGLLAGYGRFRDAITAVDSAFEELKICQPPLFSCKPEKKLIEGKRGKILDVVYTLRPSREFIAEMKAASKRKSLCEDAPKLVDKSGSTRARQGE